MTYLGSRDSTGFTVWNARVLYIEEEQPNSISAIGPFLYDARKIAEKSLSERRLKSSKPYTCGDGMAFPAKDDSVHHGRHGARRRKPKATHLDFCFSES